MRESVCWVGVLVVFVRICCFDGRLGLACFPDSGACLVVGCGLFVSCTCCGWIAFVCYVSCVMCFALLMWWIV